MNCFILNLSKINANENAPFNEIKYYVDDDIEFSGTQTNEAPTKYFMNSLASNNKVIDKIVVLETKECYELIQKIGNISTHDYFFNFLKSYIENNNQIKMLILEKYNSVNEYIENAVVTINTSENIELFKDIYNNINNEDEKTDFYIDFTGGSRVNTLLLLYICRLAESLNGEVVEVIYANIQTEKKRLENCTNYYRLFSKVEIMAEATKNHSYEKQSEVLYGLDLISSTEFDEIRNSKLDEISKETENNVRSQKVQTVEQINIVKEKTKKSKGLMKAILNNFNEKTESNVNQSGFEKLKLKSNQNLIDSFHDEIIGIFYDKGIIVSADYGDDKDKIREAIKANVSYYNGFKFYNGVIPSIKIWIEELKTSDIRPIVLYLKNIKVFNNRKTGEFGYWDEKNSHPKGISCEWEDFFCKEMQKHNYSYNRSESNYVNNEIFKKSCLNFNKYQRKYFNSGFPFMCKAIGINGNFYPEIMEYYLMQTKSLMEKLDDLKKLNEDEYKIELEKLTDDENALREKIPMLIEDHTHWKLNDMYFDSFNKKKEFINSLSKQLEEVRPYRNANAHKNNNSEFYNINKQNEIADKIRNWLNDYIIQFDMEGHI